MTTGLPSNRFAPWRGTRRALGLLIVLAAGSSGAAPPIRATPSLDPSIAQQCERVYAPVVRRRGTGAGKAHEEPGHLRQIRRMHVEGGVRASKVVQGRPDGARRSQRFHQRGADRTRVASRGATTRSLACLEHDHLGSRRMQEPGARESDDAAAHDNDRTVEHG